MNQGWDQISHALVRLRIFARETSDEVPNHVESLFEPPLKELDILGARTSFTHQLQDLAVQILKAAGCSVIGIDIDAEKLKIASDYGVDAVAIAGNEAIDKAMKEDEQ